MKRIKAWWWVRQPRCHLSYGDTRTAKVGVTHEVKYDKRDPIECCVWGLHGSKKLSHARFYGCPDRYGLFRVILSGKTNSQRDKIAASSRKYVGYLSHKELKNLLGEEVFIEKSIKIGEGKQAKEAEKKILAAMRKKHGRIT